MPDLEDLLGRIPAGYSTALYRSRKYGVTKTEHNNGRSVKIFAESLSGEDFVSLNAYFTISGIALRPCEMPEEKVIDFLENVLFEK